MNPVDIFRTFLINFGLTGVADMSPIILGIIMIIVLIVALKLVMGIIQNVAKLIVTVISLGLIAWILMGMFG